MPRSDEWMIPAACVAFAVATFIKLVGPGDAGSPALGLVGLAAFSTAVVLGIVILVRRLRRKRPNAAARL